MIDLWFRFLFGLKVRIAFWIAFAAHLEWNSTRFFRWRTDKMTVVETVRVFLLGFVFDVTGWFLGRNLVGHGDIFSALLNSIYPNSTESSLAHWAHNLWIDQCTLSADRSMMGWKQARELNNHLLRWGDEGDKKMSVNCIARKEREHGTDK